jgi:hypothetical protein
VEGIKMMATDNVKDFVDFEATKVTSSFAESWQKYY